MDIYRCGAKRNCGTKTIINGLAFKSGNEYSWRDNVWWSRVEKAIYIRAESILHTDKKTHHDYTIKLTLEDVASLIELLGHAGAKSDARHLRKQLKAKIEAIVKLLACATGIQPGEIENTSAGTRSPSLPKRSLKKKSRR